MQNAKVEILMIHAMDDQIWADVQYFPSRKKDSGLILRPGTSGRLYAECDASHQEWVRVEMMGPLFDMAQAFFRHHEEVGREVKKIQDEIKQ